MTKKIVNAIKTIGIYIIIFAVLLILYSGEITFTSRIPRARIEENLFDAYTQINEEGLYHSIYKLNLGFYDNWTDAISCNILACQDSEHPFYSGIANAYVVEQDGENVIDAFNHALLNNGKIEQYSNFWLGNLLFVKILLIFLKWGEIRYLLNFIVTGLEVVLAIILNRRLGIRAMLSYLIASMLLCITYNSGNIQASADILIMQIGCILILLFYNRLKPEILKGRYEFFFIIGSIQFFMGYIFAPMFPLGMFLIITLLLDNKERIRDIVKIKYFVFEAVAWIAGYGLTAITKQLIAYVVLENQVGITKMQRWSSGTIINKLTAFIIPLKSFNNGAIKALIFVAILIIIMLLVCKRITICTLNTKKIYRGFVFLLMAAAVPYTYFAILSNAVGHAFYCQNMLCVVFMFVYIIACCFEIHPSKRK